MQTVPSSIEADYWSALNPVADGDVRAQMLDMLAAGHIILAQLRSEHGEWKRRVDLGEQEFRTQDGVAWQRRFRIWCMATRRWVGFAADAAATNGACQQDLEALKSDLAVIEPAVGIRQEDITEWLRSIEDQATCFEQLPELFSHHDSASTH